MNITDKITRSSLLKKFFLLAFLFFLFTLSLAFSYSNAVFNDIKDNVFRLHVIANSDSSEDQQLKYIVRDEVLKYVNNLTKNTTSKEEVIQIINLNKKSIEDIARQTVISQGFSYPVSLEIGTFEFPTKTYGDISFPPGFYDALKIKIGSASGQNWWCVMFPPLCFIDISSGVVPDASKELMENEISTEGYNLISTDDTETNIKFKIVELFQDLNITLSKI